MNMALSPTWRAKQEFPFTRENIVALLNNEIPEIRIPRFATAAECESFVAAMESGNVRTSRTSGIGYIGAIQTNHRWTEDAKAGYLTAAEDAWTDLADVTARSWDPLARITAMLRAAMGTPVDIAEEPGRGRFFAGVAKLNNRAVLRHVDFAPLNMPDWHIAGIDAQIAWNLFLTSPGNGGQTTVWNRPWNAKIVPGEKPPMSYGLSDEWVEGAESWTYTPYAGDVVLFNSRNPHSIAAPEEGTRRWQIGSFIGRQPDGSLVLWS